MGEIVKHNEFLERSDGNLRGAILHADTLRQELSDRGEWEQLAFAVEGLRKIKADLDTLLRECENDVARLLPDKKVVVDGLGQIERRTTLTRKWESEDLLERILKEGLANHETGEISPQLLARLSAILKAALPLTASLGWRVTGLQSIGIEPDEFSDKTYGRQTIQITN